MALYIIIFVVAYLWLNAARNPKHPLQLNVYFGVPGSGKTTFAAYLTKKANRESLVIRLCKRFPKFFWFKRILNGTKWKRKYPVWSNVPIKGAYKLNAKQDLGKYMIENGKVILDESGVEFNNRDYKSLPKSVIEWAKYHRHYGVSVDMFSQSHDDMDVTFRRLAQNFYVVRKSLLPKFVVIKRIRRKVGIDDMTHQIIDKYYFGTPILDTKWIFCPPLWKLFDSYECKELPQKEWEYWDSTPPAEPPVDAPAPA